MDGILRRGFLRTRLRDRLRYVRLREVVRLRERDRRLGFLRVRLRRRHPSRLDRDLALLFLLLFRATELLLCLGLGLLALAPKQEVFELGLIIIIFLMISKFNL